MVDATNSEEPDGLPMESLNDIKLTCRAVRERWPMSTDARAQVVESLRRVIQFGKSASVKIKAVRALALLDAINLKSEQEPPPIPTQENYAHANLTDAEQRRTRLSAISARLGIGGVVVEGSATTPAADSPATSGA